MLTVHLARGARAYLTLTLAGDAELATTPEVAIVDVDTYPEASSWQAAQWSDIDRLVDGEHLRPVRILLAGPKAPTDPAATTIAGDVLVYGRVASGAELLPSEPVRVSVVGPA